MASVRMTLDTGDAVEAMTELRDLYGTGVDVPMHIRSRILDMIRTHEGLVDIVGRRIVASHELLSILATLRALRQ